MQYQIFNSKTGELVAWINPELEDVILKKGYDVQGGDILTVQQVLCDKRYQHIPKCIAKFEKVSWGQYCDSKEWNPDEVFNGRHTHEYEGIKLPKRATKGSAGYDFFSPIDFVLKPNETIKIPTGIRCKIKDGYVLEMYPRSGLGFKYRLRLENTVGIIDSDYYNSDNEGHIFVKMTNEGNKVLEVKSGEAICQGLFKEFFLAEEEEVTTERNGGFGSTSK